MSMHRFLTLLFLIVCFSLAIPATYAQNEIVGCSPKRLFRGDNLTVTLQKSHGANFAIYHEKTREFFFLLESDKAYYPRLSAARLKNARIIKINTETSRNAHPKRTGREGLPVSKRFFDKSGWYSVVVGDGALDVEFESMPITGSCRVYYVNRRRK